MACIWFYIASFNSKPDCWAAGLDLFETGTWYKYLVSLYWSMQTITTVGFGDISIGLLEEYILALGWMVFGVSIYTICIGNVSTIIASIDTKAALLANQISTLQQYAIKIELDPGTAIRIQKFLENNSSQANSLTQQDELIQKLPPSLRSEVLTFKIRNEIEKLPFLNDKNQEFQSKVLKSMRGRKLYKGDILYSEGDVAEEIIFILSGTFTMHVDFSETIKLPEQHEKAINSFNVPIVAYSDGSYFGDDDILADIDLEVNHNENDKIFRSFTVEANTDAEIMTIKKRHLQEQLQRFKDIGHYMIQIA